MDLQTLQEFLDNNIIPVYERPPKTFLEVARQPHFENVISNIYAFYFDVNEEHGLEDLFIQSLIDCIKQTELGNEKSLEGFSNFTVETEVTTNKNGRIDLLISGEDGAIIIENKIYHHLNNNLEDYWDSIINNEIKVENSTGIVLSLKETPVTLLNSNFINITHIQLLNAVMKNIGQYLLNANDKYFAFLKDFYQNIKNLSMKLMKREDFDFYFNNLEKINQLMVFDNNIDKHLKDEVEKVFEMSQMENFVLSKLKKNTNNENRIRYYVWEKNPDLMFTIIFDKLKMDSYANKENLYIILELKNKALENRDNFKKLVESDCLKVEEKKILNKDFFTEDIGKRTWIHFARKNYVVKKEEIYSLSDYILKKLEDDCFLSLFEKVVKLNETGSLEGLRQQKF